MENCSNFEEVKKIFKLKEFCSSQHQIINDIIAGKNALVIMPAGMGKSLCYQFPALLFKGLTIVMSPLISLMKDQVNALHEKGIAAAYINSSLNKHCHITEVKIMAIIQISLLSRNRMWTFSPQYNLCTFSAKSLSLFIAILSCILSAFVNDPYLLIKVYLLLRAV